MRRRRAGSETVRSPCSQTRWMCSQRTRAAGNSRPSPPEAGAGGGGLGRQPGWLPPPPEQRMTADRVRGEHSRRVLEQGDRNVWETARRLRMHRRTLQRILGKRAPHN